MHIDVARLPSPDQIDHPAIRKAAENFAASQKALKELQRELGKLEDGREAALQQDAEAAEAALAQGKAMPRRRHIAEHTRRLDELEHEVRVAALAAQRARRELQSVLDEHGPAWLQSLDERAAVLDTEWDSLIGVDAPRLHAERSELDAIRRLLGSPVQAADFIELEPTRLFNSITGERLELAWEPDATARRRRRVRLWTSDVVEALARVGRPIPEDPAGPDQLVEGLRQSLEVAREWSSATYLNAGAAARGQTAYSPPNATPMPVAADGTPVALPVGGAEEDES